MSVEIITGDCLAVLKTLPAQSIHCCVTSPPYWGLRDYGVEGQIGLEPTLAGYVDNLVAVLREVRRVLRDDGTLWLNLGDSYAAQRGGTHMPASTLAGGVGGLTASGERVNQGRNDGYNPTRNASKIGLKHKDLIGIPWRVAFALQADGWWLRQDIVWSKPNPMPESVTDRCTRSHEYIFMLTKSARYYYDAAAIADPAKTHLNDPDSNRSTLSGGGHGRHVLGSAIPEKQRRTDKQRGHSRRHAGFNERWDKQEEQGRCSKTRNKRSVWTVSTAPFKGSHFATFPPKLIEPCILAGCPVGGTVLDPFGGAGTTGLVADRLGRNAILIELNSEYAAMAKDRIADDAGMFAQAVG